MGTMKRAMVVLAVLSVVIVLSGCGSQIESGQQGGVATPGGSTATPGTPGAHAGLPDRVRIVSDEPMLLPPGEVLTTPQASLPEVMLSDVALTRQLYATINALPVLPQDRACTAERGPHYTLTFLQGNATVATVQFHRDGCWPVFIAGESTTREGSKAFVQQLDQAMITATPLLKPDRFAIATAPNPLQAPKSAQVTSATTAQQLYDAILSLPRTDVGTGCSGSSLPAYQLVFFSGDQALHGSVDDACQTVEVDGGFQWRGGRFAMNDQFRNMFQAILAAAPFAPSTPDHLSFGVNTPQTVTPSVNFTDDQVIQALYSQVFQLPVTAAQPNCPPADDKLSGKGTFTTLAFTQWDLPLVRIDTYQGSCSYVQMNGTGPVLKANQTFWDLIDRVQKP
ncbi:MAG TPA: hypothetical protein VF201_08430 [Nitrolancea sp.]